MSKKFRKISNWCQARDVAFSLSWDTNSGWSFEIKSNYDSDISFFVKSIGKKRCIKQALEYCKEMTDEGK